MICIYQGEDSVVIATVEIGGVAAVDLSSTVSGAIVTKTGTVLAGPKDILSSDDQNDWPNGIVALNLTPSETSAIPGGVHSYEIHVVQASKTYIDRVEDSVNVKIASF